MTRKTLVTTRAQRLFGSLGFGLLVLAGSLSAESNSYEPALVESLNHNSQVISAPRLQKASHPIHNPALSRTSLFEEVLELLEIKRDGFVASELGKMTLTEVEFFLEKRQKDLDAEGKLDPEALRGFDSIFLDMKVIRDEAQKK